MAIKRTNGGSFSLEEGRDKRTTVFWRDNEVGWTRSDGGNIAFVLPINFGDGSDLRITIGHVSLSV